MHWFQRAGVDVGLVERLSLNRNVSRTHIGFMGCHGALNGLRVASALSRSTPGTVLVCCVELCSLHHQYTRDPQQIVANSLFSDGAAAVVGSSRDYAGQCWQLLDQFSTVLPDTADNMAWRIGDHGFEMRLSPAVPAIVKREVGPWLAARLAEHSLRIADVKSWAIHPGGPRILAACGESLGLAAGQLVPSQQVLADYGNMSSPTVLFILKELLADGRNLPCVMLAFGPGLTIEAALVA